MSREIKFRAWDKVNKKWLDFFAVKENGMIVIPIGNLHFRELEDVEVMQYINLNDKNDKELYEGDIVKRMKATVEIVCGNQFGQVTIKRTFKKGKKNEEVFFHELWEEKDIEKVGNIYENKQVIN